tara:strand:+ start:7192 stop:7698 length:507 start_codon:yes stop_codon:yes gene_type:complete
MPAPKGYKKANDKPTFYFNEKVKKKARGRKDSLPKDMTAEEFKKKYGKVVWCDYYQCIHNEQPEGVSRTIATILGNPNYKPLGPADEGFVGVCNKEEIGIRFKTIISPTGVKQKVPECFNGTSNQTGRMDMSRFLQPNGTPYGGSIESQSSDQNFSNSAAFGTKWKGK